MGINIFSDMTEEETSALLMTGVPEMPEGAHEKIYNLEELNETVDWRTKGVV